MQFGRVAPLFHKSRGGAFSGRPPQLCWAGLLCSPSIPARGGGSCVWVALPPAGLSTSGGGTWGFEQAGVGRSAKGVGWSVASGLPATVLAHQWGPERKGQQVSWLVPCACQKKREQVVQALLSFPPAWPSSEALASSVGMHRRGGTCGPSRALCGSPPLGALESHATSRCGASSHLLASLRCL